MIRQLLSVSVFFLFLSGVPTFAHEGHSHDASDAAVAIQFHQQFLNYLKSSDFGQTSGSQAYVEINGQRYPLNSSFYELLRLTLKAADPEACGSCVVEEVKQQSHNAKFLNKVTEGLKELFSMQTVATSGAFLDEYGYAAGVGYVLMEVLEHTAMGPLGICPLLNLYYLYTLDMIKQSQYVFASTYKASIPKALYFSFRSAFETVRMNRALKRPIFIPAGEDHIQEHRKTWSEFKKLRKEQGRYRWFMWQSWLDKKLSKRTLWPSAYVHFDLDKVDAHAGHAHASPFKLLQAQPFDGKPSGLSFLKCETTSNCHEDSVAMDWWQTLIADDQDIFRKVYEQLNSESKSEEELTSFAYRIRDVLFIASAKEPVAARFLSASALQDILTFEFQALETIFQNELNSTRATLSTWQYISAVRRFHKLKITIKKYGASLKAMAMEKEQVPVYELHQSLMDLGRILGIFEKASSLIEREQPMIHILAPISEFKSCQELLT